jgi:hypothetical protein
MQNKDIVTNVEYWIKNWNPARANELAEYKIKTNTSRRMREILKQQKTEKCMNYVGTSLEKFRIMLQSKFVDGMTWRNYGETMDKEQKNVWHIDHKIPCNSFDFTNPVHVRACFHYKNLQPLWWSDNIEKKDNI